MGEAAKELQALFSSVPCFRASSMEDAVERSREIAQSGDGVLLSPACASYDMFKNFEERGNVFKAAVDELK
jgi:UDP-N-acetylmuramoylalanine--D-glutamate ligase